MTRWHLAACAVGASLFACEDTTPDRTAAETNAIAYRQLVDDVAAAADNYRTVMLDPGMTAAMCASVHDNYDAQVRWVIPQMMDVADDMDSFMAMHDGAAAADLHCLASSMMAELDQHAHVACTWDLAGDRMEALRDVVVMLGYTSHGEQRCTEIENGLDGHGWSWGDMMHGCSAMP